MLFCVLQHINIIEYGTVSRKTNTPSATSALCIENATWPSGSFWSMGFLFSVSIVEPNWNVIFGSVNREWNYVVRATNKTEFDFGQWYAEQWLDEQWERAVLIKSVCIRSSYKFWPRNRKWRCNQIANQLRWWLWIILGFRSERPKTIRKQICLKNFQAGY